MLTLSNAPNTTPGETPIKAGLIASWQSYYQTYGYVEVRAKVPPAGLKNWFALWLVNKDWRCECDFAEFMGKDSRSYTCTIHNKLNLTDQKPTVIAQKVIQAGIDLSLDFHVYGMDWQPDYVRFYLDNKLVFEYTGSNIPNVPMYFIADIAYYPADAIPTGETSAEIDYVRIYSKNK